MFRFGQTRHGDGTANRLLRSPSKWTIAKTMIVGVVFVVGGFWFWCGMLPINPFDELALLRRGQVTPGTLVDTVVQDQSEVGVYSYIANGREYKTKTRAPLGELKAREDVEYLPDVPSVSRIRKGKQWIQGIVGWVFWWGVVGLGTLAIFLIPGISVLQLALRQIRRSD